ncbi:nucleoside hydrolase [Dictyobacter formicarum]|uniref:Nucleoside hydrolase n=1 Tax=Dictyobacter formicarum TaxID=2778368 RepID=A0ABQ3V9K0_9CHLR|nr:nucleoside hydrolase [Dictyobacter formicarum]GHO82802.1 nucleoside hydrolase [Dictyobacter formicarum]
MSTKVILDTDIGSDIDDAICLAYLLAQPECDLLGITTVSGEANKRAMMASALCKIASKNIPILPGVENPLLIKAQQPKAPQAAALDKWEHDTVFPQGEAIEFLRQTIRSHPGEVVLLGIGPLTNLGLLFSVDPEIPGLLKELVLMCGVFTDKVAGHPEREWNALNDPHATHIVYQAPVRRHRSLGLDVTTRVTMNADQFREKCVTPLLRPVLDFANVWFKERDQVTFHDPLAATTIFDSSICAFTPGTVEVELDNKELAGKTYWTANQTSPRHEVALDVHPERFFEAYFRVF